MSRLRWPPASISIDDLGIGERYKDTQGKWQRIDEAVRTALAAAMAARNEAEAASRLLGPLIVRPGQNSRIPAGNELRLEDGTLLGSVRRLPADIPLGYHWLEHVESGTARRLIVTPGVCHLPDDLSIWGWSAQLYSVRSKQSWGIGDLSDLARLGRWSTSLGAGVICVNPLAADTPVSLSQASPYSPSSRCFRNVLYVSMEDVPGAGAAVPGFEAAVSAGRALNHNELIDRDAILRLKMPVLQSLWASFPGDRAFDKYLAEQGELLTNFARFCALAELHGRDWRKWPAEYRHPQSSAVCEFAERNHQQIRFHVWVQWLLDVQLARAAAEASLMQDLPVGVEPGGADAWAWQEVFANNVSVGAPPDMFNCAGQNWGLPPFSPYRLRAVNYEPFIQTIRSVLRHAGGLRIDHVMGLFRVFCVPDEMQPTQGAYVYFPAKEMLDIVALESHRAQAFVVGEDLGTVAPQIRTALTAHKILSYRLVWFEQDPPAMYPRESLAAVSTHDLPTIAGLWTGHDELDEVLAGLPPNPEGWNIIRSRLQSLTGVGFDASVKEVILDAHQKLTEAPSMVVMATLEDASAAERRPNMPGTVDSWPNWSRALPSTLEDLEQSALARELASEFNQRRKHAAPQVQSGGNAEGLNQVESPDSIDPLTPRPLPT